MQPIQIATHEESVKVAASPEAAWELISDPTRTPEWSPVVRRSAWIDGHQGPAVGARFRGHNRFNGFRWRRDCVVTESEPGRVFAFSTLAANGGEQTRWRYVLAPSDAGARITLSFEIVSTPRWVRFARRMPGGRTTNDRQARANITESLRRIRDLLERDPA
ncbi:MAG TPA: SRPBCC family protein [Acidimicrobiia bacterium]|nr:SRPBCC family protein [Acidimicrobiia bacterium]